MAWVGFTDDELKRLRQQHGDAENKSTVNSTALKRAALNPATKRQRPREKLKTRTKGNAEARSREDGADVRRMTKMEAKTESCSSRAEHEEQRENSSPESDKSELPKHTRKKSSAERGTTSPVSAKTVETSEQESEASLDQPEVVIIEEPERLEFSTCPAAKDVLKLLFVNLSHTQHSKERFVSPALSAHCHVDRMEMKLSHDLHA